MSKEKQNPEQTNIFEEIKQGLSEAIEYEKGEIEAMINKTNTDKEVVYFHMATKGAGENSYPPIELFITIMNNEDDIPFVFDDEWAKENEVCIIMECFSTFIKFYITATKDWVEKNCPTLLTEHKEYLKYPDDEDNTYTTKKNKYLKYEPENFGVFIYMTEFMKRFLYNENN